MKMSDVFDLPLTAEQHMGDNGWWTVDQANSLIGIDESADGGFEEDTSKAIAHAINNHDALVEALDMMVNHPELADITKIRNLLEEVKGTDAER